MSNKGKHLTQENIDAINAVLAKDQRVEVVPTKDGVRVFHIKRQEVNGATRESG